MLPQKPRVTMRQFAVWLEEYMTKLVAGDEAGARVEPREAMSTLTCVGKPPAVIGQPVSDWWVAIFQESGLRDDVTIRNLQDAYLKLVIAARAHARELQVDMSVGKANKAIVANAVQTAKRESGSTAKSCRCT